MRGAPGDDADPGDEEPGIGDGDGSAGTDSHSTDPDEDEAARTEAAGGEAPREDAADGDAAAAGPDERDATRVGATGADPPGTEAADIDPGELTVAERSLHPRIRILWVVRAALWALVLGGIATALTWAYLDVTLLAPAVLAAVLLVLFVTHAVLRYRVWRYEFREDAIYLERGVLRRVRTVVPFVRIQHVDTARGPIERVAGLSTLVVYTAGSRGADVTIPGIEADRASDHQRRLKQLAIAAEDDTAV